MPSDTKINFSEIREDLSRIKSIYNFLCSGACPDDVHCQLSDVVHKQINKLDADLASLVRAPL